MDDPLILPPQTTAILNIVLFQPEIPGNTGAIGRTAVALGAKLWLVRPLGFNVDEKTLRRAGLDYWQHLDWEVVNHWDDLLEKMTAESGKAMTADQMWFFSRFATKSYTDVAYRSADTLVFGRETSGLPEQLTKPNQDRLLRIPTTEKVRSLNLATSVGIAAYEVLRQVNQS